jgi:hypothetical protein
LTGTLSSKGYSVKKKDFNASVKNVTLSKPNVNERTVQMLLEIDDEVFDNAVKNWMMKEYEHFHNEAQLPHFNPEENVDDRYVQDAIEGFKLVMAMYMAPSEYETFFERFEDAN